ncbi:hypothetical protein GQ43DRAFT_364025, partial [Delitschia confertaspora ATCC 74209]
GPSTLSVKEAVKIARDNNFMGLICSSRLLDLAPALVESIKTAGLVLIADISDTKERPSERGRRGTAVGLGELVNRGQGGPGGGFGAMGPAGVDGVLRSNGVFRFNESVDM